MLKKGQISIFIIIGIIILLLFVFLISGNFGSKKKNLAEEPGKDDDLTKLNPLNTNIDFCLEKQLKRALIIAGIRGGFLYKKDEYYLPTGPTVTYNQDFLSNMNINVNSMKTMVHLYKDVYSPIYALNKTNEYYNQTIVDNFESYVLDEFLECLNLKDYEEQGYEIIMEDYIGEIQVIDPSTSIIKATDVDGLVGDTFKITLAEESYYGKLTQIIDETYFIQFESSVFNGKYIPTDLSQVNVINMNKSVNVEITFKDEEVTAELNFPAKIKRDDYTSSIENSIATVRVRFIKLLELSQLILFEKRDNRSIDLTNPKHIEKIFAQNSYFRNTNLNNITIVKTIYNDTPENKKFIYSLIDYDSMITGNPYEFRFGYHNDAPIVDLGLLESNEFLDEGILFVVAENQRVEFNLLNITHDYQGIDPFLRHFEEYEYYGGDAYFHIYPNGKLIFEGYQQKSYSFDITVTDFEAERTHTFIFIVGFPSNEDNQDAINCFDFENFEVPGLFPIENKFKNLYEYYDGTQNVIYGYQLYISPAVYSPDELPRESELKFTCNYYDTASEVEVTINGIPHEISENNIVKIPQKAIMQEVVVSMTRGGNPLGEPYKIKIYPATCLGPHPVDEASQRALYGTYAGGELSCCDTEPIVESIENDNPQEFTTFGAPLLSGDMALDVELYLCYTPGSQETYFSSEPAFDYIRQSIWSIDSDISSIFTGNLKARCNGKYPTAISKDTLQPITSGNDYISTMKKIKLLGDEIDANGKALRLKKIKSARECEFCMLDTYAPIQILDNNNIMFVSGIVDSNPNPLVMPIPNLPEFEEAYIFCSSDWYGSSQSEIDWQSNAFGKWVKEDSYRSQGYCTLGSNTCERYNKTPSNTIYGGACTETTFDGNNLNSRKIC